MPDLPFIFRWSSPPHDIGRKGQRCAIIARSERRARPPAASPVIISPLPPWKNFNTVALRFADGFTVATSGNAIRRAAVSPAASR